MTEIVRGENGGSEWVSPRRKPQATLIVDEGEVVVGLVSEKSLPPSLDVFEQHRLPDGLTVIDMSRLAPTIEEVASRQLVAAREARQQEEASQLQTPVDQPRRLIKNLVIGGATVAAGAALGSGIVYAVSSLMDK